MGDMDLAPVEEGPGSQPGGVTFGAITFFDARHSLDLRSLPGSAIVEALEKGVLISIADAPDETTDGQVAQLQSSLR